MAKTKPATECVDELSNFATRKYLRGLCPCRTNSSDDLDGWRTLFNKARHGSFSERKAAAHSIGTLIARAQKNDDYRALLRDLEAELDALMRDPRSASQLLGVMKGHGHQRKGMGRRNFRKAISVLDLQSPTSLAHWLNGHPAITNSKPVEPQSKVVKQLARWLTHRVKFEPGRQTSEADMLHKVRLLQPSLFAK